MYKINSKKAENFVSYFSPENSKHSIDIFKCIKHYTNKASLQSTIQEIT